MKERIARFVRSPRKNTSTLDVASFPLALVWLALIPATTQVLAANPTFFRVHASSPLLVGLLLVFFLLAMLGGLWLILAILKRSLNSRGFDVAASVTTGIITLATTSLVAARLLGGEDTDTLTWAVAVIIIALPASAVLTLLARQFTSGKVLLTVAAVVSVLPLVLLQAQGSNSESGVTVSTRANAPSPPILLVIADELAYGTVQDDAGNVRPQYPNLKSLQMQSTTYTHAYATANATHLSVPSMLIGLADAREMPNLPGSLQTSGGPFTWLQPRYNTSIISPVVSEQDQEAGIAMLPEAQASGSTLSALQSLLVLAADLAAIMVRTSLPEPFTSSAPVVDDRWFDFWGLVPIDTAEMDLPQLVETLTSRERPGIALWHTMLTHTPYQRDFDGNWWENEDLGLTGLGLATPQLEPMHRALYAASAREFDRQLGALLDQLKAAGTFEQSLIVVTADHGRTFGTQSPWRVGDTRDQRWGEVAHVPLIVKQPEQQTPSFVSSPRTLAQVGPTINQGAGITVTGPQDPAPPLDQEPASAPAFWFDKRTGEAGFEFLEPYDWPDRWLPELLTPGEPDSQFIDPQQITRVGQPLPANYSIAQTFRLGPDQGPSPFQAVKVEIDPMSCAETDSPGLVVTEGRVVGSIILEPNEDGSALNGWSVLPIQEEADFSVACSNTG